MYDSFDFKFPPQMGWECPKCGRVNAPWISECPCYAEQKSPRRYDATCKTASTLAWTSCNECVYEVCSPNCPSFGKTTAASGCFEGIRVKKGSV